MIVKEKKVKSIITKSNLPINDYCINPYVGCGHACLYCYASFMKRFTGHSETWGTFVDAKDWGEIKNPKKYKGKEIFIGSVTDPYQPLEKKYGNTRKVLEQLKYSGAKITIATKSDLILRDLDLIKAFPNIIVSWSINTLDEGFKNDMDCSISIERKLKAMEAFHNAGIKTACFISPIFPEITDCKEIINRVKNICSMIWLENLNLRGEYKPVILNYIKFKHKDKLELYNQIYCKNDKTYWKNLDTELKDFCKKINLNYVYEFDNYSQPFDAPPVVINYFYYEKIKKSAKIKYENTSFL